MGKSVHADASRRAMYVGPLAAHSLAARRRYDAIRRRRCCRGLGLKRHGQSRGQTNGQYEPHLLHGDPELLHAPSCCSDPGVSPRVQSGRHAWSRQNLRSARHNGRPISGRCRYPLRSESAKNARMAVQVSGAVDLNTRSCVSTRNERVGRHAGRSARCFRSSITMAGDAAVCCDGR
jgi:hypothetical protein